MTLKRSFGDELDPETLHTVKKAKLEPINTAGASFASTNNGSSSSSSESALIAIWDEENEQHSSPTTSFASGSTNEMGFGNPPNTNLPTTITQEYDETDDEMDRETLPKSSTSSSITWKSEKSAFEPPKNVSHGYNLRPRPKRAMPPIRTRRRGQQSLSTGVQGQQPRTPRKAKLPPKLPVELKSRIVGDAVSSLVEDLLAGRRACNGRSTFTQAVTSLARVNRMFYESTFGALCKSIPKAEEKVEAAMALAKTRIKPAAVFPPEIGYDMYKMVKKTMAGSFNRKQKKQERSKQKPTKMSQRSGVIKRRKEVADEGLKEKVKVFHYDVMNSGVIAAMGDSQAFQSTVDKKVKLLKTLGALIKVCDAAEVILSDVRPTPASYSISRFDVDTDETCGELFESLWVELHHGGVDTGGMVMERDLIMSLRPGNPIRKRPSLCRAVEARRDGRRHGVFPALKRSMYGDECDCFTCTAYNAELIPRVG